MMLDVLLLYGSYLLIECRPSILMSLLRTVIEEVQASTYILVNVLDTKANSLLYAFLRACGTPRKWMVQVESVKYKSGHNSTRNSVQNARYRYWAICSDQEDSITRANTSLTNTNWKNTIFLNKANVWDMHQNVFNCSSLNAKIQKNKPRPSHIWHIINILCVKYSIYATSISALHKINIAVHTLFVNCI